ncbi:hypothetical protein C8J57DRAFT_1246598 [Mycena rebaudengoi]|nr:hypothetical protein C8J57DRAFT_1246598 [Mycena rebaudengoi]
MTYPPRPDIYSGGPTGLTVPTGASACACPTGRRRLVFDPGSPGTGEDKISSVIDGKQRLGQSTDMTLHKIIERLERHGTPREKYDEYIVALQQCTKKHKITFECKILACINAGICSNSFPTVLGTQNIENVAGDDKHMTKAVNEQMQTTSGSSHMFSSSKIEAHSSTVRMQWYQHAMHDDMAQEGAALTQDDTYRQQREMRRYREHQQRRDDARTIGRDAGAQHSAAAAEACLRTGIHQQRLENVRTKGRDAQTQYATERSVAQGQVVNAACPQDEAWNSSECQCRERRGLDEKISAEELFRRDLGPGDAARMSLRQIEHPQGPTDARTNVWNARAQHPAEEAAARERAMGGLEHAARQRREALQYYERQQRHEGAVVADSEALVLRDLAEEEDFWVVVEISCLEAEKQRVRDEAARPKDNRAQLQRRIDEDMPCRITEERARRLTRSNTSRRALRVPTILDEIIDDSMGRNLRNTQSQNAVNDHFRIAEERARQPAHSLTHRTVPDEIIGNSMSVAARKTRSQREISDEHCITEERARRATRPSTRRRTSHVPTMPNKYVETLRVTHDFYDRVKLQRSRIRDLVNQGFSKIPDQKIAWHDNIPYKRRRPTGSQPMYMLAGDVSKDFDAGKREQLYSQLSAEKRRHKGYLRPADTTTAAATAPMPRDIGVSERPLKKSLAAKHNSLNTMTEELLLEVQQDKEKYLHKNALEHKHGHGKENEEAPSKRGLSASLLAVNSMHEVDSPSHNNTAAAPALQSIVLEKRDNKQPSQLHPPISYSERFLKKSLGAKHTNTGAKKSSLAEDRGYRVQRADAKSSRDKTTNERHLKKSLAVKHTNTAAKKSPLAEDMEVQQDEAKVSRESLTDYSAVEYNRCPNQSIPSQLGVPSKRLPKESSAANLKRTNTVIGVELDEVDGARQVTQSPNNGRSAGQATPTRPRLAGKLAENAAEPSVIRKECGALRSYPSGEVASFHQAPPPPAHFATPVILPIPSALSSASSKRSDAESTLPSSILSGTAPLRFPCRSLRLNITARKPRVTPRSHRMWIANVAIRRATRRIPYPVRVPRSGKDPPRRGACWTPSPVAQNCASLE